METTRINVLNLRNEEHFHYQSEFKALVVKFGAKTIGIDVAVKSAQNHFSAKKCWP